MKGAARRRPRGIATAVLALSAIVASLAVCEAALRFSENPVAKSTPAATPSDPGRDAALAGLPELVSVLELARPNVRGVYQGVLHRTNDAGIRGPSYAISAPAGVYRIGVAGDSYTMGHRVEESESYVARLESLLNESAGRQRYEVLNLGLSGLAASRVLRRLERVGLPYAPDLIVYGFTLNDIEGPAYQPESSEDATSYKAALARYENSRKAYTTGSAMRPPTRIP